MMKWKRIVSAAVCVCMAGMLITGCGVGCDACDSLIKVWRNVDNSLMKM